MTTSKRIGTYWTDSSTGIFIIKTIGTCFGIGYIPKFPDAFASVVGILLYLATSSLSPFIQGIILFLFILIAIGIGEKLEKILRCKDPSAIVIDEVTGMWLTLSFLGDVSMIAIFSGFVLFRFFDNFKPFPINLFQTFKGGLGIMADDIAAGMAANMILRILILKSII
jgi:phosphatidylglycerophosphatase A